MSFLGGPTRAFRRINRINRIKAADTGHTAAWQPRHAPARSQSALSAPQPTGVTPGRGRGNLFGAAAAHRHGAPVGAPVGAHGAPLPPRAVPRAGIGRVAAPWAARSQHTDAASGAGPAAPAAAAGAAPAASATSMSMSGPLEVYMAKVQRQQIAADPFQLKALAHLQELHFKLKGFEAPNLEVQDAMVIEHVAKARAAQLEKEKQDTIDRESAKYHFETPGGPGVPGDAAHTAAVGSTVAHDTAAAAAAVRAAPLGGNSIDQIAVVPPGLYMWGPVGCGKTMIMDMFYENADVPEGRKQRVHFYTFMRDVLKHMHVLSTQASDAQKEKYDHNMLRPLAKAIAKQSVLLCFDEIQIPDIGTAAILYRLFKHLQEYGVTIVATSNQSPSQLYKGHFCTTYFEPWVAMMDSHWRVHELQSTTDYRRRMAEGIGVSAFDPEDPFSDSYFTPLGATSAAKMELCWRSVTAGSKVEAGEIVNFGRKIEIPECTADGVARFDFGELCDRALGPKDYLAIAREHHTIFLYGVPMMNMARRDQARRLISLVDALYECNTKLYCSAQIQADRIFEDVADTEIDHYDAMHREAMGEMFSEMSYGDQVFQNKLFTGEEELFASARCISRIMEMQSPSYKELPHRPEYATAGLDLAMLELGSDADDSPRGLAKAPPYSHLVDFSQGGSESPAAHRKVEMPEDRLPRFTEKHFYGYGWWEKIRDKLDL